MKAIIFEMGQKVRCAPDCGDRSGMLGTIVGEKTLRFGFGSDGSVGMQSYRVQWEDEVITPATQVALEPAPPVRGDLDNKVGWCWFDPDVERAIKEGPKNSNPDY